MQDSLVRVSFVTHRFHHRFASGKRVTGKEWKTKHPLSRHVQRQSSLEAFMISTASLPLEVLQRLLKKLERKRESMLFLICFVALNTSNRNCPIKRMFSPSFIRNYSTVHLFLYCKIPLLFTIIYEKHPQQYFILAFRSPRVSSSDLKNFFSLMLHL